MSSHGAGHRELLLRALDAVTTEVICVIFKCVLRKGGPVNVFNSPITKEILVKMLG